MVGNMSSATTTNISGTITDYSVNAAKIDESGSQEETTYEFPDAGKNLGYYKNIPELKGAIDNLGIYVVGLGWTANISTTVKLERINGWGEDSFISICKNLFAQKKIQGDAFAEIIRNEKTLELLNLKPLYTGNMKIVCDKKGRIKRYEYRQSDGKYIKFKKEEILHLCNDRIGDEIHGTSIIESCKWVIDARNEALEDERMIKHRDKALGIIYYDTDNNGKISYMNTQIENAVKKGEMLGLPKGTAEITAFPSKQTQDRLQYIQYLENFFYQAVRIPRVIATSENYTEAASKVGFMTFEPIYTNEQQELEADLWNQLAIRIRFNRPPSLSSAMAQSEAKNTGQTNFQANELNPVSEA